MKKVTSAATLWIDSETICVQISFSVYMKALEVIKRNYTHF